MRRASFSFRTLEEAKSLVVVVTELFGLPDRVAFGLSELLVNAVEHGNLGITYAEKSELVTSNAWNEEVTRRLDLPEYRERYAALEVEAGAAEAIITVRDQGAGFDWVRYLEFESERKADVHGRGIALASVVSFSSLEYRGNGSEVVCTVVLDGPESS